VRCSQFYVYASLNLTLWAEVLFWQYLKVGVDLVDPKQQMSITIIVPGDPDQPSTGAVIQSILIYNVLSEYFHVKLFRLKGCSSLMPPYKYYITSLKWVLDLVKELSVSQGIVYIIDYTRITILAIIVRKLLCRNYKIVNFLSQGNFGPSPNSKVLNRLMTIAFSFTLASTIRLSDGILWIPGKELSAIVPNQAKFSMKFTSVLDFKGLHYNTEQRRLLRQKLGIENRKVIGIIGPFHKNNKESIAYVSKNLSRFPDDFVFLFVGHVDAKDKVQNSRFFFVGHVADLSAYISACDCVLIPRFVNFGSPMNKMMYSMAVGVPVVTNNAENMGIINKVHAGIGSLNELPDIVKEILSDKMLCEQIGENGRNFVHENFSIQAKKKDLANFLSTVLLGANM
jgi:glycosyltransferase involved in cell wall biosynthesis